MRWRLILLLVAIGGCAGVLAVVGDVFPQAPMVTVLSAGMASGVLGAVGELIRMWRDRSEGGDQRGIAAGRPAPATPRPPQVEDVRQDVEFASPVFLGREEAVEEILRRFDPLARPGGPGRAPGAAGRTGADSDRPRPLAIAVTGEPGMGKSELATQIADRVERHFPDGRQRYELFGAAGTESRPPRRPAKVLAELLRSIGHPPQRDDLDLKVLRRTWRTLTRDHRLLLIFDDAEDFAQVEPLLPGGERCAVLITSTDSLADGSMHLHRHPLAPLAEEAGVRLLRSADESAAADSEPQTRTALADIVAECGGRPLTLVLCRRVLQDGLSTRQLLEELRKDGGESLFTDRSVATVFRLLFRARPADEQLLLGRLAKSGLTSLAPWAAAALLRTSVSEAGRLLESLHNRSLLRRVPSGDDALRYRTVKELDSVLLRSTPRELGVAALERPRWSAAATTRATDRLLAACAWLAERAAISRAPEEWGFTEPALPAPAPDPRLGLRLSEHPGAWFAAERRQIQACLKLSHSTAPLAVEWRLQRALAAHCRTGRVYWADWRDALDRSLELARLMGERQARGICLLERAELAGNEARHTDAVSLARRARAELAASDERWQARAARAIGVNLYRMGQRDTSEGELRAAAAVFERRGEQWWHARTRCNLGELNRFRGDFEQAYALLTGARTDFERLGDAEQAAKAGLLLGEVLGHLKRDLEAWLTLRGVLDALVASGSPGWYRARCLRAMGRLDNSRLWLQYDDCDLVLSPERRRELARRRTDFFFRKTLGRYDDRDLLARVARAWHESNKAAVEGVLGEKHAAECTAGWADRRPLWSGESARRLRADKDGWTPEAGVARVEEAHELLVDAGDEWGGFRTLLVLGELRMKTDPGAGRRDMEEAAEGFGRLGNTWWQARAWRHTADALYRANATDEAERKARLAKDGYQRLSNLSGRLRAQLQLGWILFKQGEHRAALDELNDAQAGAQRGRAAGIVPETLAKEVEDARNRVLGEEYPLAGR
ncbi:NB-ARC domain-containing protein [Streptomonospora litoralis]|nr:NB-ARC domain-containing protein [Streptomonospora litoralis]